MNYLSLFTGIGGFDLGFDCAGHKCIGQCEIDNHARSVLRYHWPNVERITNVKDIQYESAFAVRPELICGGFPCQDLSVAGKRAGLAGGRSGLWFEYRRIIALLKPRWVIVENVPGLLSSQEGRDFAMLIRGLEKLGYVGVWKTFDSQYFGVAQRRRRVFIIGYLGGKCQSEILFESESLQGNPAQGRKAGERIACTLSERSKGRGYGDEEMNGNIVSCPLTTKPYADNKSKEDALIVQAFGGNNTSGPIEISTACNASRTSSGRQDFETETFVIGFSHIDNGRDAASDISPTLRSFNPRSEGVNQPVGGMAVAFAQNQRGELRTSEISPQLTTGGGKPGEGYSAVCFDPRFVRNGRGSPEQICQPLKAQSGKTNKGDSAPCLAGKFGVRRLTPRECERLQGFPDDWTRWAARSDGTIYEQSDTQRYRQLGNAVTVSVAEWIGKAIGNDPHEKYQ